MPMVSPAFVEKDETPNWSMKKCSAFRSSCRVATMPLWTEYSKKTKTAEWMKSSRSRLRRRIAMLHLFRSKSSNASNQEYLYCRIVAETA